MNGAEMGRWTSGIVRRWFTPGFVGPSKNLGFYSIIIIFSFCFFRAAPTAHGGSKARSGTGAAAAGLHHSHSSAGSGPPLTYTTAHSSNTRSLTHCVRPGIEPATSWFAVRFVSAAPQWELLVLSLERKNNGDDYYKVKRLTKIRWRELSLIYKE